jgi:TetR/AcrR family transcriptional regulator, tetracycline repressor protein
MRLERRMVVRAALELLNDVGLDGLTTRRLAEGLGVQGPALYWHFKNKQELIDEMALALLQDAYGPMALDQDWAQWLTDGARRLRRALLSYRDGARLLAGFRPPSPHGRIDPTVALAPLVEAFGMPDALWALLTVNRFTLGWTMDEQAAQVRDPPFAGPLDPEEGFEFALGVIMAGLWARLAQSTISVPEKQAEGLG